jgi:dTDP-4-amino-4,6-dideoxygalactose transaminase|tara:strand:+ start:1504 stop:2625 length:1122 start_codon:yes stop_codon:yes gene_type:complete
MQVPFNDLNRIHEPLRETFHKSLDDILDSSSFVGDTHFASEFKKYTGAEHCITCNSGTDALYLAIKSLELPPGSKILVPAVSYAATAMAVVNAGHVPVFADVDPTTGLTESLVVDDDDIDWETSAFADIKCIIIVHLFGQVAKFPTFVHSRLSSFAARRRIPIIEDCAQAHGAMGRGGSKHVGLRGDIGCFSFYPGKNLGALGDGGACITNDKTLAVKMKQYASLGAPKHNRYEHNTDGVNSRMDGLQGLFLATKLKLLDDWTSERKKIAGVYQSMNMFPQRTTRDDVFHVFYTLEDDREGYIKHMKSRGVQTGIHYPISLPDLKCFEKYNRGDCKNAKEFCAKCVSLPIFPYMSEVEIFTVLKAHAEWRETR